MPSRAEARRSVERLARGAALVLLAAALWRAVSARRDASAPRAHVRLTGAEQAATRDSLAALARSGTAVSWDGEIGAVAAMAEPLREPAPGWRLSVIADRDLSVRDSLSALDSLAAGGGALIARGLRGRVEIREGTTIARVSAPVAPAPGRLLVLGRAGWESKFTVAALEEDGWLVDATLALSDTMVVRQGARRALDVATYAAVIVLDPTAARDAAGVTRFVRAGGGLLLAGEGAGVGAFRELAPAAVTRMEAPENRSFAGVDPFTAMPLHLLGRLRADAVVLERHGGAPTVVARRVGAGRVAQAGVAETWRWRMEGDAGSPAAHRAWWTALVAQVAYVPGIAAIGSGSATKDTNGADAAPLAATIAALGPATAPVRLPQPRGTPLPAWLGALILGLLLLEWASRRTRGVA